MTNLNEITYVDWQCKLNGIGGVAEGVEEFLEAIEDEDEFNRISSMFMERLGEDYDFIEE